MNLVQDVMEGLSRVKEWDCKGRDRDQTRNLQGGDTERGETTVSLRAAPFCVFVSVCFSELPFSLVKIQFC